MPLDAASSGMIGNEKAAPYESCLRPEPLFVFTVWCGGGESNPHGLLHKILSLARLPIPPPPRDTGHYTTRSIGVKSSKQNPPRRSGEAEQCKENIKLIMILSAEVELNREGTDDEYRLLSAER